MDRYIFTFGSGHRLEGKCQPIYASSSNEARDKMIEIYGLDWGFQYSGKEWQGYKDDKDRKWVMETELEPMFL